MIGGSGEGESGLRAEVIAKFDARLAEQWSVGTEPLAVMVDMVSDARTDERRLELAQLGLAALNDLVIGRVSREQLIAIAERDDVTHIAAFGTSALR